MRPSLVPSFLCLASYFSLALSFSVTIATPPDECGSLTVSWIGGQPPFEIMLVPVFNIPRNISVPSSAFSNNQGSYQISPFPLTNGTQFLLTMSDATGFGAGGVSELFTVGEPVGSPSCNTSNPALPFSFSLPSSLQQCSPYIFNDYGGAALPVTVTGFIPGGDLFLLHPPSSTGTAFTWTANVAAGTTLIFTMTDAKGNSGGSSDNGMVALSNDASCLNHASPSSTVSAGPSSTTSPSTSSPTQTSSSSVPSSTIIGAAVGAPLATAVIVAIAVCYLRRQRGGGSSRYGLAPTRRARRPDSVDLDPGIDNFQHPPIYPFPYQTDSVSHLAPPVVPSSASYQGTPSTGSSEAPFIQRHSRSNSNTDSFAPFGDVAGSTMSSGARRKAAMAGVSSYQPATRFVVHTDAEDCVAEGEPEVVELPPQYSERRTPAAPRTEVSSMSRLSSADLAYLSGQHASESP